MKEKEQLRKRFDVVADITDKHESQVTFGHHVFEDALFEWFYSEIEARESIIQAADEMFKAFFLCVKELDHNDHAAKKRLAEATEKYNSLKKRSDPKPDTNYYTNIPGHPCADY